MNPIVAKWLLRAAKAELSAAQRYLTEARSLETEMEFRASGKDGWRADAWKESHSDSIRRRRAAQKQVRFLRLVVRELKGDAS